MNYCIPFYSETYQESNKSGYLKMVAQIQNCQLTIGVLDDADVNEIMCERISKLPSVALATVGIEGKFSNVIAIMS